MAKRVIVLDAETTGLNAQRDEILQLTILSDKGKILFNEFFRPTKHMTWPDSEKIHHISYEMVKDCEPITFYKKTIQSIINNADVIVGYNHSFDMAFLESAGIHSDPKKNYDLMLEFSQLKGDWDSEHNHYRWYKLKECADYYGYDWGKDSTHNSLSDCRAALFCYHQIISGASPQDKKTNDRQLPSSFQKVTSKRKRSPLLKIFLLVVVVSVIAIGFVTIKNSFIPNRGKVITITTSSLVDIIDTTDLSTMKYTYNSLVKAVNEKNKIDYYVTYCGTIKAGIDLSEISKGISIDSKNCIITITLPPVKIHEATVDAGSLEYLFVKGKNTEKTYAEALALCKKDIENAASNGVLLESARENAETTIRALLSPWIGNEYSVVFK